MQVSLSSGQQPALLRMVEGNIIEHIVNAVSLVFKKCLAPSICEALSLRALSALVTEKLWGHVDSLVWHRLVLCLRAELYK